MKLNCVKDFFVGNTIRGNDLTNELNLAVSFFLDQSDEHCMSAINGFYTDVTDLKIVQFVPPNNSLIY